MRIQFPNMTNIFTCGFSRDKTMTDIARKLRLPISHISDLKTPARRTSRLSPLNESSVSIAGN
jgi:hypothetical protein